MSEAPVTHGTRTRLVSILIPGAPVAQPRANHRVVYLCRICKSPNVRAFRPGSLRSRAALSATHVCGRGHPIRGIRDVIPTVQTFEERDPSPGQRRRKTSAIEWKRRAAEAYRAAMRGSAPLAGPVHVEIFSVFPLPKSAERVTPELRPDLAWHAVKPDMDNVEKAVLDAAQGLLWTDDARIARKYTTHVIGAQGEMPAVALRVWDLTLYHPRRPEWYTALLRPPERTPEQETLLEGLGDG